VASSTKSSSDLPLSPPGKQATHSNPLALILLIQISEATDIRKASARNLG
jgi:hypothetical protein